jgi:hypothetical protein
MVLTHKYGKRPGSDGDDANKVKEPGLVLGSGVHLKQLELEVALAHRRPWSRPAPPCLSQHKERMSLLFLEKQVRHRL